MLYNIIAGRLHESNVTVLSPIMGSFAARFFDLGASVKIGKISTLVTQIRDIFCIIANTIMTADVIAQMSNKIPVIWIIHEWWNESEIIENLRIRNNKSLTLKTIKQAFSSATMIVFVCESQKRLYNPLAPSKVIYIGVLPPPVMSSKLQLQNTIGPILVPTSSELEKEPFLFLCLGIICPRKNQCSAVKIFKQVICN